MRRLSHAQECILRDLNNGGRLYLINGRFVMNRVDGWRLSGINKRTINRLVDLAMLRISGLHLGLQYHITIEGQNYVIAQGMRLR